MYCPKCGDVLKEERGIFICERGQMELSQRMAERLYSCFVSKTEQPEELSKTYLVGGKWFCPGCGLVMHEEPPGVVRCPSCGRNIAKYVWELVELHPHTAQ